MRLLDVIILALSIVFLVIGVYEMVKVGIAGAYWSVMICVALFFWYTYRKRR